MKLSPHFTLEEFTFSDAAIRHGIDNKPTDEIIAHLEFTAQSLEVIRKELGHPIFITSGYRSQEVNRLVGGSTFSAHCDGWAVDFTCPDFGRPYQVALRIADMALKYDQLINEHGRWCHISFDPRFRQQNKTIFDKKIGYVTGIKSKEDYYA